MLWHLSSEHGRLDIIKYLIEQGVSIHYDNDIVLRKSAANGHLNIVKYLVEQGADIYSQNNGYVQSRVGIINYQNQILTMCK
jgi:ankyrin repeat protein